MRPALRVVAVAALVGLVGCTPAQTRAWLAWHGDDPEAAVAFLDTPEGQAMLDDNDSDGPQFAEYLRRDGCDGIYDEFRRQGASHAVAQRFAYGIAPRESGCSPQFVRDHDDWSYSRFGLNGLTAAMRARWADWCHADVRSDTAELSTDVRCALAAHARMGWSPWS